MPSYLKLYGHILIQMLKTEHRDYYKVKEGQTLCKIAEYFSLSPYLLAVENGLQTEPVVGQILHIPKEQGNCYVVREGDSKELLCGSEERFERLNGTKTFYIGMKVWI